MRRSIGLERLEQFVEVARKGSLSKAAAALSLSQPTLTRNIRSLEAELGAKLFSRHARGTVLSEAGARFLPRAEALLNEAERALAELGPGRDRQCPQIKLGVSPNFFFDLLPEAISALVAREAQVNIETISGTRETIAEELRRNGIDLGLCLIPDFFYAAGAEAQHIQFEPIGQESLRPYAAPAHPAAGATALDELCECRWAVPYPLSVSYRFESAFYRHRLPVPVPVLNAASLSLIKTCVVEHGMIALLPERFAAAAGRLAPIAVEALTFNGIIGLMHRKDVRLLSSAMSLAADIRRIAGKLS